MAECISTVAAAVGNKRYILDKVTSDMEEISSLYTALSHVSTLLLLQSVENTEL